MSGHTHLNDLSAEQRAEITRLYAETSATTAEIAAQSNIRQSAVSQIARLGGAAMRGRGWVAGRIAFPATREKATPMPAITNADRAEAARRRNAGENAKDLALEYGVRVGVILGWARNARTHVPTTDLTGVARHAHTIRFCAEGERERAANSRADELERAAQYLEAVDAAAAKLREKYDALLREVEDSRGREGDPSKGPKTIDAVKDEIAQRFLAGESAARLAQLYDVSEASVRNYAYRLQAAALQAGAAPLNDV